ncbi:MAG: translocation/assembly module TamB domain-containing protein [Gammaproteobacteria bacterium]|nr:translocation/assembly module TamB domain-containing protein [Gammaproteobacteria bacterium]
MTDTENSEADSTAEARRHKLPWLLLLALIIITLAGTAAFVATTETGLKWMFDLAARNIPGELRVERLEGRLIDSVAAHGLHYKTKDARTTVAIDDIKLEIRPVALLYEQLHITRLNITGLNYTQLKSPEPLKKVPDIRLQLDRKLDKAIVSKITVNLPDRRLSYPIENITLAGRFHRQRLHIDELEMQSPLLHATLRGTVKPQGDYPLNARILWTTTPKGYSAFSGETTFKGDLLNEFDASTDITAPFKAALYGTVTGLLAETRWQASLELDGLSARNINTRWPQLDVSGKIRAEGDLNHANVQSALHLKQKQYAVDTHLQARYEDKKIQIRELTLALPDRPTRITAQGIVTGDLIKDPQLRLAGKWRSLAWPLSGEAVISSEWGNYKFSGGIGKYRLAFDTVLTGKNIPPGHWSADGEGSRTHLKLTHIHGNILDGNVTGSGALAWKPQLAWSVDISGNDLNPGQQWPQWPGRLALQTRISGTRTADDIVTSLDIHQLNGQLRDIPLDGSAFLVISKDGYELPRLNVSSGSANLAASGRLDEQWDLRWKLDIQDLGRALAAQGITSSGTAHGSGSLSGPLRTPRIIAMLNGKDLAFNEHRAAGLHVSADVDMQDQLPSQFNLRATRLRIGTQAIDSVTIDGSGQATRHELNATLNMAQESLVLRAQGGLVFQNMGEQNIAWKGMLTRADASSQTFGHWSLTAPGPFAVARDNAQLGPWCWNQTASQVCVDASRQSNSGWQGNTQGKNLPMIWFKPLLPPDAALSGAFDASLSGRYNSAGLLTGEGKFIPTPGSIVYPLGPEQDLVLAYTDGSLEANLGPDTLNTRARLTLLDRGIAEGTLALPRSGLPAILKNPMSNVSQLTGQVNAQIHQLDWLPDLLPGVENTQGKVNIALALAGTMDKPRFTGEAKLEQGTALVPRFGLRLRDIQMLITGNDENSLTLKGQVRSGDGIVQLAGQAQPDAQRKWEANLTVKGERFEAARTPEFKANVSPDLTIKIAQHKIDVNGNLLIPEANIEPRDLSAAIRPSEDIIVEQVGGEEARADRWEISSLIGLKLGDQVKFKGFGLSGRFTGDIALIDLPRQLTTALGEIRIEDGGEYSAFNQKLTVKKGGKLLFAGGPINNPGLDARAIRLIPQIGVSTPITVGLNVRGTLQSPVLSAFSEPAMPEADALSYLLLGRPMRQASAAEGQQLSNAALGLGLAGGEMLAQKIGKAFGIEEVRMETRVSPIAGATTLPGALPSTMPGTTPGATSTTAGAALVLGKYLTPKLYISYGVGVIDRLQTLRLRYQLSRRWTLEGEGSGLQSGADLLYNIEKK